MRERHWERRSASHATPLLAAVGVGAGRVYLGVHWPTDVLAGWLFAEGWLHLAEAVMSVSPHPRRLAGRIRTGRLPKERHEHA